MEKIILIGFVLALVGCNEENKRAALEQRFQQAYPQNWQQKLLEYDIEQARLEGVRIGETKQYDTSLQRFIRDMQQAAESVDEGNRRNCQSQHGSILPPDNSTYWQEKNAREQSQDRFWQSIRPKTPTYTEVPKWKNP